MSLSTTIPLPSPTCITAISSLSLPPFIMSKKTTGLIFTKCRVHIWDICSNTSYGSKHEICFGRPWGNLKILGSHGHSEHVARAADQ